MSRLKDDPLEEVAGRVGSDADFVEVDHRFLLRGIARCSGVRRRTRRALPLLTRIAPCGLRSRLGSIDVGDCAGAQRGSTECRGAECAEPCGCAGTRLEQEECCKWWRKLIEVIDGFCARFPENGDVAELQYRAAFLVDDLRGELSWDPQPASIRRLKAIIEKWPGSPWAHRAAHLWIKILARTERWAELSRVANDLQSRPEVIGVDPEFQVTLKEAIEVSALKSIDDREESERKVPSETAADYRAFVAQYPESRFVPRALVRAMRMHAQAGETEKAAEVARRLVVEFAGAVDEGRPDIAAEARAYLASQGREKQPQPGR